MQVTHSSQLIDAMKSARIRQGLSQAEAAARAGYTRKWLSDVENHRSDPPLSMVVSMLAALEVPLELKEGLGMNIESEDDALDLGPGL